MRFVWVVCAAALLHAQPEFYQFQIDEDGLTGAVDFSRLNTALGARDRVFVRDGHFFRAGADLTPNTPDDERVDFFGTNLAFDGNLPAEADAPRIARRLRRLGFNLVRLHHLDTSPDSVASNARSLLTTGPYPTLNTASVRRLRTFIDALKTEGIWINLNLHVGYEFRPAVDAVPAITPFPTQSKPLRMLHPRMIELQLDYVRKVSDALQLKDDPAVAMIEINNETSLVYHWQNGALDTLVTGEYRTELTRQWNKWLGGRYASTDELRAAWGGADSDGADILPGTWRIENHNSNTVALNASADTVTVDAPASPRPIIVKQIGFTTTTDRPYMAEIEMRADVPAGVSRSVYWDVKQDVSPWRTLTGRTVAITNDWQRYTMLVTPTFAMDQVGRFAVSIENVGARMQIRNWRLFPAGQRTLRADESLDAGNVVPVSPGEFSTEARLNDYLRFLVAADRFYLDENLRVIRESVGPLVPVTGTQMGFGGLLNLDSHDALDYQDNHFYVDHYNFPAVAWDGRDWRIRDSSMIGSGATVLESMAVARQAGRPYTVSEYNQAWPNTYGAELHPILAAFGRFQDWDGVMQFAYAHNRNWDNGVPNNFNITGDWARLANLGQSALLFRGGLIRAGDDALDLPLPETARYRATRERRNGSIGPFLNATAGFNTGVVFRRPVRLAKDSNVEMPSAAKESGPLASPQFTFDRDARLFSIHAPGAAGVFGFAGSQPRAAGALTVELAASARGFCAILLTALDGASIEASSHLLLSNPGYVLRSQPNVDRPQQLVNYRGAPDWWTVEPDRAEKPSGDLNGGRRPVWMERVEAVVNIKSNAERLTVYPLDGQGKRRAAIETQERTGSGYRVHLQADGQDYSPWYEIVAER